MLARVVKPAQCLLATRVAARPFSVQAIRLSDKSAFDANKGSVGQKFTKDGEIGSKAEQVGGPFASDGAVGKQFTKDGAVGGTAQEAAEQIQGDKKSTFDKDGAIGGAFKADGAIGSIGEKVGGPFSKDGAVGKHFNADGSIGGTVQEKLGDTDKK